MRDVSRNSRLVPYIGDGGRGSLSLLTADHFMLGNTLLTGTSSTFSPAYQGFAGVRYRLSDRMKLGLALKLFGTEQINWEPEVTIGTSGKVKFRFDTNTPSS